MGVERLSLCIIFLKNRSARGNFSIILRKCRCGATLTFSLLLVNDSEYKNFTGTQLFRVIAVFISFCPWRAVVAAYLMMIPNILNTDSRCKARSDTGNFGNTGKSLSLSMQSGLVCALGTWLTCAL